MEYPIVYELDDTGESNGIVHFYCCLGCRSQSRHKLPDASNYGWDMQEQSVGMQCETCGRIIERETND